jgi:hypothetical protein
LALESHRYSVHWRVNKPLRASFIRDRLYSINAYLSGSDGKGYDALQDDVGIDPRTFGKLHKAQKRKFLAEIYGYVSAAIVNDLRTFVTETSHVRYDVLFDELARLGEAAGAINWLLDYYGASPLSKDMESVE